VDLIEKLETLSKEKENALELSNIEKIAAQTRLSKETAKIEQLERQSVHLKKENDELFQSLREVSRYHCRFTLRRFIAMIALFYLDGGHAGENDLDRSKRSLGDAIIDE
jgi:hypothetical protein